MPPIRFSFLPTFFVVLAIAFVIVAAVRVHSINTTPPEHRVVVREAASSRIAQAPASPVASIGDGSVASSDSAGTFATSTDSADDRRRITEREQRYNDLLKSPPPPAPPPPASASAPLQPRGGQVVTRTNAPVAQKPPVQPSLLSRIGNAIARAVGAGGTTTSSSTPQHSVDSNIEKPKEREPIKDPNSDTTPPTLVTVDFAPPLVHD